MQHEYLSGLVKREDQLLILLDIDKIPGHRRRWSTMGLHGEICPNVTLVH